MTTPRTKAIPKKRPAARTSRLGRARAWLSGRTPAERRWPSRLKRWILVAIPAGFLFMVLFIGVAYALVDVPKPNEFAGAHSTIVLDRRGRTIARLHADVDRIDVPAAQIPAVLRKAVIAAEDHDFYTHGGVSLPSIFRAAIANLTGGSIRQGGSTITQQYVKNAYVGNQRTIWRKVKEAIVAIKIERKVSKDQILSDYLNTIYFGRGAYGVQAASKTYFDKDIRSIPLDRAALLAGIIRSPELNDPVRHPEQAKARRDFVLREMAKLKLITDAEAQDAAAKPLGVKARSSGNAAAGVVGAHFVEDVRRLLVSQYGAARVYRGGLVVRTTLDLRLQKYAEAAVRGVLDKKSDPEAALVSIDTQAGEVLAMVGGRSFSERQFNLATQGHRQPGSSFKPFVLAAALNDGISIRSRFRAPASITLETGFEPWKVSNYDKHDYGTLDLIEATEFSVNTVYSQLILKVGAQKAAEMAAQAGIASKLAVVPSLTLGTSPVTPIELAGAYADFATGGMHVKPHLIRSISESGGETLFKDELKPEPAMKAAVADTVAYALTQVVQKGTGRSARLSNRPMGGKTGTTEDHVDAWFVGFTKQISTAVWMGYPEGGRTMEHVRGIAVTGSSFPAQIWKAYMEKAVEGTPVEGFGKPTFAGEVLNGSPTPSTSPSPSGPTPTVVPSIVPTTPEPKPSPTKTKPPNPTPSPSPSPTGAATGGGQGGG
jgi:penicillin-binding protein 1A